MSSQLKLARDFCASTRRSAFGDAASVEFENEDSLDTLVVSLTPHDGLFAGALVRFRLYFEEYKQLAPKVSCLDDVYHPNICTVEDGGDVCLNVLDEDFSTDLELVDFVQALLFLLHNPVLEDALTEMDTYDDEQYAANLKQAIAGQYTNEQTGHTFKCIKNPRFSLEDDNDVNSAKNEIEAIAQRADTESQDRRETANSEEKITGTANIQEAHEQAPNSREASLSQPQAGAVEHAVELLCQALFRVVLCSTEHGNEEVRPFRRSGGLECNAEVASELGAREMLVSSTGLVAP